MGCYFNSRPHGGRPEIAETLDIWESFQLTPSRRATDAVHVLPADPPHFNSRPHGGRREIVWFSSGSGCISTHALTEGDKRVIASFVSPMNFNSRPHGGRPEPPFFTPSLFNFNSRPHGGRLRLVRPFDGRGLLISTHALTEGDTLSATAPEQSCISTHALTEGDITSPSSAHPPFRVFQLTPSRRATELPS